MNITWFDTGTGRATSQVSGGRARVCCSAVLVLWLALIAPATAAVGDLDGQFGQGGQLLAADNGGPSVLELPDGRILVVGKLTSSQTASTPGREVAINRYLASGLPDTAFGGGGQVVVTLPVDSPSISAIARQPDGRVVMAGSYWVGGGRPFVARIEANGTLDRSFGADGISEPGTGGTEPFYSSLVVQPDGEILAAISDWTSDRIDRFAADGRYLGNLSAAIAPARMARQGDGRLIVSGYHRTLKKPVVMRIDASGRVDATFGDGGYAVLDTDYTGNLSVEPDTDRIVLCGPGIVRLTSDGHPDAAFGLHGTGYVDFGIDSVPAFDYCNRLLATKGGGIAFIGIREGQAAGGYDKAFVAGLTTNGTVDTRYGSGSGASELDLGEVKGSRSWWFDMSSSLIATRDGDALLTWLTASDAVLKLARIDLGSTGAGGGAPPPTTTPPPTSTPPPTTTPPPPTHGGDVSGGGASGGGGSLEWFQLALFSIGLGVTARSRRKARPQ